jgi:predicted XRE-type DNA-binding protein
MPNGKPASRRKPKIDSPAEITPSGGNVFADLELPQPDLARAKAELVQHLRRLILARKLTQAEAGALLGVDQPKVSALLRGRVAGYSLDRLLRYLNALGQPIEIRLPAGPRRAPESRRPAIVVTH